MTDRVKTLAMFRGSSRKEYRDQILKMLRGVRGEQTRTVYRRRWVSSDARQILESGEPFAILAFVVDSENACALPCRRLAIVDRPIYDLETDSYQLTMELGNFVTVPRRFNDLIGSWPDSGGWAPPGFFLSALDDRWDSVTEVEATASGKAWRSSIDFLTRRARGFEGTVFFRPIDRELTGRPGGCVRRGKQSETLSIAFESYNPHLDDDQLRERSFKVSLADVTGEVIAAPSVLQDGQFKVETRLTQAGVGLLTFDIRPDWQFSTFVPVIVEVEAGRGMSRAVSPGLGSEWSKFLDGLETDWVANRAQLLDLLDRLVGLFPRDPELRIRRGLLHLRQGEFTQSHADFAVARQERNDPRSVWWGLVAAVHNNDEHAAASCLEEATALADAMAETKLLDEVVAALASAPDDSLRWFAGLPGIAMDASLPLRMLIAMLGGTRGEQATAAIIRAMGDLHPELALESARTALEREPAWMHVRRELAMIAVQSGKIEFAAADADVLVNYTDQVLDDYRTLVHKLRPLIHPQRLPALLLRDAIKLDSTGTPDHVTVAIEFAIQAADAAVANGDLVVAQNALHLLEKRLRESDIVARTYRAAVVQIAERARTLLHSTASIDTTTDVTMAELLQSAREQWAGRRVVVFGGRVDLGFEDLRVKLGMEALDWVGWSEDAAPDSQRLRQFVTAESSLIVDWADDGLIDEQVRSWLRSMKVPIWRVVLSRSALVEGLLRLSSSRMEAGSFTPLSCLDAVEWARSNCDRIEFCPNATDRVEELEVLPNVLQVALNIKHGLELLNAFAYASAAGPVRRGFKGWAELNGKLAGYNIAMFESDTTDNDPRFRGLRTFKLPAGVDPANKLYMPAHLKVGRARGIAPRIHFSLDYITSRGKILVGYVGPHLENSQS